MSIVTEEVFTAAHGRDAGLITGTLDNPIRRSWRQIYRSATHVAGALADLGVGHGDRVAVLAGQPSEIAPLIEGIWMRGASITMLHQPTPRTDLAQWMADALTVIGMISARLVVVGAPFTPAADVLAGQGVRSVSCEELLNGSVTEPVATGEDDIALLQLTSGSTGTPRAVIVTHGNLAEHNHGMAKAAKLDPGSEILVSWLPLSHDMGMVGLLIAMQLGFEAVCVTPSDFLESPLSWPALITKYRATLTAAPNFAYSLLAHRLDQAPDGAYDLSSLRVACQRGRAGRRRRRHRVHPVRIQVRFSADRNGTGIRNGRGDAFGVDRGGWYGHRRDRSGSPRERRSRCCLHRR